MDKAEVKESLKLNIMKVVFTKKDGTERTLFGTTDTLVIPVKDQPKKGNTHKSNDNVQTIYDVENKGWRSFRWDSVISVNDTVFTSN
jgi:hypothetical protein